MMTRTYILCLFAILLIVSACATPPEPKAIEGATVGTSGTKYFLYGVWGNSSSNIFAGGFNGSILHYDGKTWGNMTSGTKNAVYDLWGSSSLDVFAVGSGGTILHYGGQTWDAMKSGTTQNLYGAWGSSTSDASPWVVVALSCITMVIPGAL